jgi:O-6-methylguanine DNA methyltransferase
MQLFQSDYDTPFGKIHLVFDGDAVIYILGFGDDYSNYLNNAFGKNNYKINNAYLAPTIKTALDDYFNGAKNAFDNIKLKTFGTEFQQKAWDAMKTIPYGETISYQQEAIIAGNIKAVRAIGGANNKNPIAIIIPCHRVIGKNGKMVGYGGGLNIKEWLLQHEKQK